MARPPRTVRKIPGKMLNKSGPKPRAGKKPTGQKQKFIGAANPLEGLWPTRPSREKKRK